MATTVTIADVRHVAALARLGLTEERAAELTRDLNTILEHMDVLDRVDTAGIAEAAATGGSGMRLCSDSGRSVPLAEPLETIAPAMHDGLIQVPRLATHEQVES